MGKGETPPHTRLRANSWDMGYGRKGSHPLTHPTLHVLRESGAKPLVEDLLLGQGFVRNRTAPLL